MSDWDFIKINSLERLEKQIVELETGELDRYHDYFHGKMIGNIEGYYNVGLLTSDEYWELKRRIDVADLTVLDRKITNRKEGE